MTREEAIKILKSKMDGHTDTSYEWAETVRMAIKALEQETILDKVRADVQNGIYPFLDGEPIIEVKEVLQIIDKYKAESENKR